MKTKVKNKKEFTPMSSKPNELPPQPQPELLPGTQGQPQKQVPLKELLYELNQQFDNVKAMYNNLILQQDQQLQIFREEKNAAKK